MKKVYIISCFDWYEKRIKYIEQFYKENRCEVTILCSDFNHITKDKDDIKKKNNNINFIKTIPYKKNISLRRIVSHYKFSQSIKKIIEKDLPDIVYCLVPPNMLVKHISYLKKKYSFVLLYDVIDLWPENMPFERFSNTLPYNTWKNIRNKNLEYCDFLVLECDFYRKQLPSYIGNDRIKTLYITNQNSLLLDKIQPKYDDRYVDVAYLGSINNIIDIEKITNVLLKVASIRKVRVKIIGGGENIDCFIKKLESSKITVINYGYIYEWQKITEILSTCYFGINIYKRNIKVGITIKSIDYFQVGLPLLNSIDGDTKELIRKYDVGINIDEYNERKVLEIIHDIKNVKKKCNYIFEEYFSEKTVENRLVWLKDTIYMK